MPRSKADRTGKVGRFRTRTGCEGVDYCRLRSYDYGLSGYLYVPWCLGSQVGLGVLDTTNGDQSFNLKSCVEVHSAKHCVA